MDPIVRLVTTITDKIPDDEFGKIKSVTGMVVLIVKIIEEAHKKKKLSYDDSKKLVNLVIDTLIKNRNISVEIVNYVENNRDEINNYINDSIDIWDALVPVFKNCCKRNDRRIQKSKFM